MSNFPKATNMESRSIEEQLQDATYNHDEYRSAVPTELPVGTILPIFNPHKVELPVGWVVCGGQTIDDQDSIFFNLPVPNLSDERFLMGTFSSASYGKSGGVNDIANEVDHSHTYTIQKVRPQPSSVGYQGRGDQCYVSTNSTGGAGAHNHGGENRPRWFGVFHIIKIK